MTKETKSKMSKTEPKRSKRLEEREKTKKRDEDSSDDDNESYYSSDESEEEEMDAHEYRKFLSKIFPSKHLNKKIEAGEKIKEIVSEKVNKKVKNDTKKKKEESDSEDEIIYKKSKKQKSKREEETDSSEDDDEEEEDEDEDIDYKKKSSKKTNNKYNIIFTIGNSKDDEYEYYDDDEDEWETEDEDDCDTENEDDPLSSDSDSDEDEEEEEEEEEPVKKKKTLKNTNLKKAKDDKKDKEENPIVTDKPVNDKITVTETNDSLLLKLKELQGSSNNSLINECIKACETKINEFKKKDEKKTQKYKDRNERIFRKIISDKNTMNDFAFFNKMDFESQIKIIKELREINNISRIEKPYRLTLLESTIPTIFKAAAMKKISSLRHMEPGSGESYKIKNWLDNFMRLPFGKVENLPVSINDGVELCHDFMEKAKKTLDDAVFGLNDAKMQIMQMVGQLITNPKAIGTAIAIHGPPGTGKTSLVKEGISKILNRPFAFIALGGATDSSFLEGHSYTYEGSTWGQIVQILIDSKCMNPVIYFDELDKISDTPKGEEIAGILTHLTDTSQNSQFHDKYFAEIDFDLSKCLFIFSYNDESKVNPILKDRMYRIETKGYDKTQKMVISNQHLLPKIREQVKFESTDIIIPDETLHYLVEEHCANEDGVRNLKRCLEIIHTKLNLYRLMKPGSNLFEEEMSIKVSFPFTVTREIVDKLIKRNKESNYLFKTMYV